MTREEAEDLMRDNREAFAKLADGTFTGDQVASVHGVVLRKQQKVMDYLLEHTVKCG